jgi:hypothetical protein
MAARLAQHENAQHLTSRICWLGGIGLRTRAVKSPASIKSTDAPRFDDRYDFCRASGTTSRRSSFVSRRASLVIG